jgi:hypothetical protein
MHEEKGAPTSQMLAQEIKKLQKEGLPSQHSREQKASAWQHVEEYEIKNRACGRI